jgi:hypothetical protein
MLLLAVPAVPAAVSLEGEVALDYYVAEVDDQGYEFVDAEFYAERIANDAPAASAPLSLAAWMTADPSPAGEGAVAAEVPVGVIPGSSSLLDFTEVVEAEDLAPGEYYAHTLLQDDTFPGTYEDFRTLSPLLLWRGGLEAVGPLDISSYGGGFRVAVDFAQLRNNRIDEVFTNDIALTLYATHGFGPASSGYTLCTAVVDGLYAGTSRSQPGFDCDIADVPDGEYTLHLDVAEIGGRAGYSTLSGPDVRFTSGRIGDGYSNGYLYVSGAFGANTLLTLLLALPGLLFRRSTS